jgi:hypothetical protein
MVQLLRYETPPPKTWRIYGKFFVQLSRRKSGFQYFLWRRASLNAYLGFPTIRAKETSF